MHPSLLPLLLTTLLTAISARSTIIHSLETRQAAPPPAPAPINATSCAFGTLYTVLAGDTATSISTTHNASTRSIININGLRADGSDLAADAPICIPPPCWVYAVQAGDICEGVAKLNGVSLPAFKWWNGDLDGKCTDLVVGFNVCVSEPKKAGGC